MPIPSFQTLPVCAVYLNKFVSLQRSANTSAQYLSQLCDTKRGFIEKIRQINQEIPHCSKACLLYTLRKHKVIIQRFTDNSNTLFRNTQMLLLVILLNKNVSHCFDVLVSVISAWSFVSTRVGVIGVSSSTKPDSGITSYAIIFVVSKYTNSRCSEGVCGIAVAPFGVESLLVTVRL